MGRHTLARPSMLPVLPPRQHISAAERRRVAPYILEAIDNDESLASIARRINRSTTWVSELAKEYGRDGARARARARFQGPARAAAGYAMSAAYHQRATVKEIALRWGLTDPTVVVELLAEWEVNARANPIPSEAWRRAHLPPDVMPADLNAPPSEEEWVHLWTYLSERRAEGALITELVGETGLGYRAIQHGLTALRVQPERK